MSDAIKVGPVETPLGTSYFYRIGDRLSESGYANTASARHDARKPQGVNERGRLQPL